MRTLSDYPVGVPVLMGTDDVRVAGAATMNYLQTIMPTGAIAFFGMRSAMTNRRHPDFALTSTPPTCEPEVDRADIDDASDMSIAHRHLEARGGRDRAATCHPLDRCTIKGMSNDKYPAQNWLLLPKRQRRQISRWE